MHAERATDGEGPGFNQFMKSMRWLSLLLLGALTEFPVLVQAQSYSQPSGSSQANLQADAEQILALANQARARVGARPLQWDPALAAAALKHCLRMVAEGPISHRYGGEEDLSVRAAEAGAHFSVIEENVAIAPTAAEIHEEWMESPGHRENLLNPEVDHVGIAVVQGRRTKCAVADYSRVVEKKNAAEVETQIATLVAASGVSILRDPSAARATCVEDGGMPPATPGLQPHFVMRWQDAQLDRLPQELAARLQSGRFRMADVGSCPAREVEGSFTSYRIAVILY